MCSFVMPQSTSLSSLRFDKTHMWWVLHDQVTKSCPANSGITSSCIVHSGDVPVDSATGEDLKHMQGAQVQEVEDKRPALPLERLLKRYFAFVQQVSAEDPIVQLTFWRVSTAAVFCSILLRPCV
jgi:hypothetical protein